MAFADNCAPCHGAGGGGAKGYPNLNDDDWLWGGKLADIEQHHPARRPRRRRQRRIRATCRPSAATVSSSPTRSRRSPITSRSLSGLPAEQGADLALGKKMFADNCAACHGPEGKGNREVGAPNLTDEIWLYGSDKETIMQGIVNGRGGVMPAWGGRLDEPTIKALDRLRLHPRRRREIAVLRPSERTIA